MMTKMSEIKSLLLDDERQALALVDKDMVFPWVNPWDVDGIDLANVIKFNRAHYFGSYFPDLVDETLPNFNYGKGDDEILMEYIEECVNQRNFLKESGEKIQEITAIQHLKALLYLVERCESHLNFTQIDRSILSYRELDEFLLLIERAIFKSDKPYIKEDLKDFAYFVFCYAYVSPEVDCYKEIKRFLFDDSNIKRLDALAG